MPQVVPAFEFSADHCRIDTQWVHTILAQHSYWAADRSREVQDAANAGSRCYGVYRTDTHAQVAFARLVTDAATFGWLCDVIVDPALRGRGVGKMLLAGVVAEIEPLGLTRTVLATEDAHDLYSRYGWEPMPNPSWWMERPA